MNVMTSTMMKKDATGFFGMLSSYPEIFRIMRSVFKNLNEISREVKENINNRNETVNLVLFTAQFGFIGLDLFKHFHLPHIGLSPPGWAPHLAKYLGNPENPSYQPELTATCVEPMTFSQRLANTMMYSFNDYEILGWLWLPWLIDLPTEEYRDFIANIDLLFLGSHVVTHSPIAWAPNTIEIGGIHCTEGKKLPDDLQNFLDAHPEGVIYVSFGSTVKPSQMPIERKKVFIDTFRQLQYPVIWKWDEDTIKDLPSNVRLSKWLPQQDLLAHPNLRVFVTHGGLLSLQEALFHQTPLVGIPLGNDQMPNLLRAEKKGFAVRLDWISITTENFLAAINKAMTDEDMKKNMKNAHNLFVDSRDPPLERALWWVDYVIRNQGAKFLRPHSVDLPWFQYHLLDVIAFILAVLLINTFIIIKCCVCCFRCCTREKVKTE